MGVAIPNSGLEDGLAEVVKMPPVDFRERAFRLMMSQNWMGELVGRVGMDAFDFKVVFCGDVDVDGVSFDFWDVNVVLRPEHRGKMTNGFERRILEGMIFRIW